MSYFFSGPSKTQPSTPPSLSDTSGRITEFLKKSRKMKGRAAALLMAGDQTPPTASRKVMGN